MKYLIDTHILLWNMENHPRLSNKARKILEDTSNEIFISHASLWELAIKKSIGKIQLVLPFSQLEQQLINRGFQFLPFTSEAYQALMELPFHHRDPFDRMMIAQAKVHGYTLITADETFHSYDVNLL
ncbi:UNVERIFIED_CONTAM: hypothetical protein GTU68_040433 [Idotea baltica]|nr:hypothetical protein [Idotea baltica]